MRVLEEPRRRGSPATSDFNFEPDKGIATDQMNTNDAIRTLQHAADYIFLTRLVRGTGNLRESSAVWQAITMLRAKRDSIAKEVMHPEAPYQQVLLAKELAEGVRSMGEAKALVSIGNYTVTDGGHYA